MPTETLLSHETLVAFFYEKEPKMNFKKFEILSFYAYAWGLVRLNPQHLSDRPVEITRILFDASFRTTPFSVTEDTLTLYSEDTGETFILREPQPRAFQLLARIPTPIQNLLEEVYETFGDLSDNDLALTVQQETIWVELRNQVPPYAQCLEPFSDDTLYRHFFAHTKPYPYYNFTLNTASPLSLAMQLGDHLIKIRESHGLLIENIAKSLNIPLTDYLAIERGEKDIPLATYTKIFNKLGYTCEFSVDLYS